MTWLRIRIHFFSSADPDPHENQMDPKHCNMILIFAISKELVEI